MLSFDTVHALTGCLLAADLDAPTDAAIDTSVSLGTLLLIQDRPIGARHARLRQARVVEIPLPADEQPQRRGGLPATLHDVAAALTPTPTRLAPLPAEHLDLLTGALSEPIAGLRLLAWAVRYDDLLADADDVRPIRRIEAVDVDGRVYQLTRLHDEPHAVVLVDDEPDPHDLPATQPGLAALVAATTRQEALVTDGAYEAGTGPAQPATGSGEHPAVCELQRLRRLVREQLGGAVADGRLDIDLANDMLQVFGLPELARRWTVRVDLTVVCEVSATDSDDAFDTAVDAITAALTHAGIPVDIGWNTRERDGAIPGEIDLDALTRD